MPSTFPRLLLDHAKARPQAAALREKVFGIWQTTTWAELATLVRRMACGLAHAGLMPQETADALARATEALRGVNGLTIHGTAQNKGPVLSFSLQGAHPHDVAQILDRHGVAIRAGHHCAQPLMSHLGVSATARASFALYNTLEEVDVFVEALSKARKMLS